MSYILISGTPGTGKTTLAAELALRGYTVFNVMELAEEYNAIGDYDEEYEVDVVDIDLIRDKLAEKRPIGVEIIEGHYADIVPADQLLQCFILDPDIEIVKPRLVARKYSEFKIEENIEAHIMQECYFDALEYYGEDKVSRLSGTDLESDIDTVLSFIAGFI
ncbi:MAG: AAA family ATPase [Candidatus Kariarchaeaceae archaeon]|jgi:adenylate kinase